MEGRLRSTDWDLFWGAPEANAGGVEGREATRGDGKRRELEEELEEE